MALTPEQTVDFWTLTDIGAPDECWLWRGPRNQHYGYFPIKGQKARLVHRIAFGLGRGEWLPDNPPGTPARFQTVVMHLCDNKLCVNPAHLQLGTHTENNRHIFFAKRGVAAVGERNVHAKLTEEAIREIREKAVEWCGLCDMMKKYRIHQMTVERILKRQAWTHVD